jgi:hypothetical protein
MLKYLQSNLKHMDAISKTWWKLVSMQFQCFDIKGYDPCTSRVTILVHQRVITLAHQELQSLIIKDLQLLYNTKSDSPCMSSVTTLE